MSLKDVQAGKYRAKAVEGAWGKVGEKGTNAVGVKFQFENNGQTEEIWHIMYLTETMTKTGQTVADFAFDTLAVLGYNETVPLTQEGDSLKFTTDHLSDKEVEIVIELEPSQKDPSKMYHKVRWVNELSGARFAGLSAQEVGGDIRAKMAAARARKGVPAPTAKAGNDLPF